MSTEYFHKGMCHVCDNMLGPLDPGQMTHTISVTGLQQKPGLFFNRISPAHSEE
jgi:hypothetical protein